MMNKVWAIACGLLMTAGVFFAPQLTAQDEDESPAVEQSVQAEQEDPAQTDPAGELPVEDSPDISEARPQTIDDLDSFVPSEEVSSDLSISYPVDI